MSIINLSGGRFVAGKDSANKFATYADDTNGGYLLFNDTANTRTSLTLVGSASAGTNSPAAIFFGNTNSTDTINLQRVASIRTLRNTNNQSADLVFETNSSGTLAEKMRISAAGSLTAGPTTGSGLTHTVDSGASTILSISSRASNTSKLQFTINGTRQNSIEVANTASFSFRNSASSETLSLSDSGSLVAGSTSAVSHTFTVGTNKSARVLDALPSNWSATSDQTAFGTFVGAAPQDGSADNTQGLYSYTAGASPRLGIASRSGLAFNDGSAGNMGGYNNSGAWFFGSSSKVRFSESISMLAGTNTSVVGDSSLSAAGTFFLVVSVRSTGSTTGALGLFAIHAHIAGGNAFTLINDSNLGMGSIMEGGTSGTGTGGKFFVRISNEAGGSYTLRFFNNTGSNVVVSFNVLAYSN